MLNACKNTEVGRERMAVYSHSRTWENNTSLTAVEVTNTSLCFDFNIPAVNKTIFVICSGTL